MRVTFVSNYINHHQIPISTVLYEKWGADYHFIQTEPMEEERIKQGWNPETDALPYLLHYDKQPEFCKQLILESDVVIFGGTDEESYISERLEQKRIVIRYSERLYREGQWKAVSPRGLRKKYLDHTRHQNDPVYLLCTGGYVAHDFEIVKAYRGKRFRWGYFTRFEESTAKERAEWKSGAEIRIAWAGRFIECKQAKDALKAVKILKDKNYKFKLSMIGGGELQDELHNFVKQNELEDYVEFKGFCSPEEVRAYMNRSQIYLFTSDYGEGWGAVVNEAMNSGCAVVASHAVGAAPFLIEHGKNGLIYKSRKVSELAERIEYLLTHPEERQRMGEEAYQTIASEWNPNNAGQALIALCEDAVNGKVTFRKEGPLSEAPMIKQSRMYRYLVQGK